VIDVRDAGRFIAEAFLIVLGREVNPFELRETRRGLADGDAAAADALVRRLLSSPEFRIVHDQWRAGLDTGRDLVVEERALVGIGSADRFVGLAYALLLGRPADPDGLSHYVRALAGGETRTNVLRSLVLSDEFARRYRVIAPQGGTIPVDTQLCELANPAKWDNPEWMALLRDLGLPDVKVSMHRKNYEFSQLAYGMQRLGLLREDTSVVSIGAGHEAILFWLANRVGRVVATDLYEGVWQNVQAREGDAGVLRAARDYAPFPYREERLTFMKMDARQLDFADATFDLAYSLSSIEHFGGVEGAAAAVDEMARVVKPGGIVALATEYVIDGPPHDETFTPAQFAALIARPALTLVAPFDDRVYNRYEYTAVDLYGNPHQTPHMVVRFDDTVFTTAFVFLRKS
jgi:ubiquinone/menaquinone biosynthesis C-methylase UbiE